MKFLIVIPIVLIAIIVSISIYLQPNNFVNCGEIPAAGTGDCSVADAIVVVSGGDTNARTDKGIELYKNGWAGTLIFSGAAQDTSGPSNAAAMRARALEAGVPASAILVEELSQNTAQNAANTQALFSNDGVQRAILVTSGYHQRRASLEFNSRATEVTILNRPLASDQDWSAFWWMTPNGWWLAVGELVKISVFYAEGVAR